MGNDCLGQTVCRMGQHAPMCSRCLTCASTAKFLPFADLPSSPQTETPAYGEYGRPLQPEDLPRQTFSPAHHPPSSPSTTSPGECP